MHVKSRELYLWTYTTMPLFIPMCHASCFPVGVFSGLLNVRYHKIQLVPKYAKPKCVEELILQTLINGRKDQVDNFFSHSSFLHCLETEQLHRASLKMTYRIFCHETLASSLTYSLYLFSLFFFPYSFHQLYFFV